MRKLYSREAEQSVLGAMLIEAEWIDEVADLLTQDSFGIPLHGEIYAALVSMRSRGQPTDVVTVAEALAESVELEYLVDLVQSVPRGINGKSYAMIVDERHQERDLYNRTVQIQALIMDASLSLPDRMAQSHALLTGTATDKAASTRTEIADSARVVLDMLDRRHNGMDDGKQIKTGLADVDKRISGFRGGDLVIIGARPGTGKTTYAMQIVKHCAQHYGKALVFSLEMPHYQLTQRLVASLGSVPLDVIRNPQKARDDDWSKLAAGMTLVRELPIVVDDQGGLSIGALTARARRERRKAPVSLVMVDYMQLMRGTHSKGDNRNLELGEISMGLKNLAKELECPVVALSQLNRSLESRSDKRPIPSDLRESGSLEQDADIIQFLYRDEVGNEKSDWKGVMEINTAKFRDGETGTDRVAFVGKFNQVTDLDAARFASQQAQAPVKKYAYGASA